jgi:hypothetical protein
MGATETRGEKIVLLLPALAVWKQLWALLTDLRGKRRLTAVAHVRRTTNFNDSAIFKTFTSSSPLTNMTRSARWAYRPGQLG